MTDGCGPTPFLEVLAVAGWSGQLLSERPDALRSRTMARGDSLQDRSHHAECLLTAGKLGIDSREARRNPAVAALASEAHLPVSFVDDFGTLMPTAKIDDRFSPPSPRIEAGEEFSPLV